MSDILKHVDVQVHCQQCGDFIVSADVIAESQRMLEEGCPGSPYECTPELYATLLDRSLLEKLALSWQAVERSARKQGTSVQVASRLKLDITLSSSEKERRSTP